GPPPRGAARPPPGPAAGGGGRGPSAGTASGPAAIGSLQFLLDGGALGPPVTAPPYSYAWNTAGTPLGSHLLRAQARDAKGFVGTAPADPILLGTQVGGDPQDVSVPMVATGPPPTTPFTTFPAPPLLRPHCPPRHAPDGHRAGSRAELEPGRARERPGW